MSALAPALSRRQLGAFQVVGASLGGLYTSLFIPELSALLDVGIPIRAAVGARRLFLIHAHADHVGGLSSFLAMRSMMTPHEPIELYAPAAICEALQDHLNALAALHGWPLEFTPCPLEVGEERQLDQRRWVRAIKTFHPVPSLGYLFFERRQKLLAAYRSRPGSELAELRRAGAPIFELREEPLLAYLTDTLPEAVRRCPDALRAHALIVECTFLDDRKPVKTARAGCHIHIDELIELAPLLENKKILLMHFSQLHSPAQVRQIAEERLRPLFGERLELLLPEGERWWL